VTTELARRDRTVASNRRSDAPAAPASIELECLDAPPLPWPVACPSNATSRIGDDRSHLPKQQSFVLIVLALASIEQRGNDLGSKQSVEP
jgi:hypothetical protein